MKKIHNYETIRVSGELGFVKSPVHLEELHERVLVEMTLGEALRNLQDGLFLGSSHGDKLPLDRKRRILAHGDGGFYLGF